MLFKSICLIALVLGIVGCRPESDSRSRLLGEKYSLLDVIIPTERAVREALLDSDPFIRGQGAFMAARHGYRSLLPLIRINVGDRSWYVRYHSLAALHLLGDQPSLQLFLNSLNDEDSSVRFRALEALADLGDYSTLPFLLKGLEDESAYARAAAAYALGKLKMIEAVPALISKLSPPTREVVKREAYIALQNITGRNFPPQPERWKSWWEQNREFSRPGL